MLVNLIMTYVYDIGIVTRLLFHVRSMLYAFKTIPCIPCPEMSEMRTKLFDKKVKGSFGVIVYCLKCRTRVQILMTSSG
jgi:hypothetical protein